MDAHNSSNQGNQKPSLSWSQPAVAPAVKPTVSTPTATSHVSASSADKSNMSAYIGIFVAGIIIGALLGWGISASRNGTGTVATSTPNGVNATSTSTSSNAVDLTGSIVGGKAVAVSSPQPAGFAVAVSNVVVAAPTWLVVYEDRNGTPGNAIGAELFHPLKAGGNTTGTITLLRGTMPGATYYVGQSQDDGDKQFSKTTDKQLTDSSGNKILTTFKAQ